MTEAPRENLLRKVLANAGLLLGGRGLNAFISLGYMALAARALGVAEFGVLVLINTFAQFVGETAKFQSWQTILQFGAAPLAQGDRPQFQKVVRFGIVLDLISAGFGVMVGVLGALFAYRWLGLPAEAAGAAALYALTVAVLSPTSQLGLLRLFDRFGPLSAQSAVSSMVRLIGGGIGFLTHAPLTFFIACWAAGSVVAFFYVATCAWQETRRRGQATGFSWSGPLTPNMPKAWRFAWATNFASTVEVAFTHVATLMVGGLLGAAEAGLWRIARQIADALAKPARLLIPALYPELAKLRASGGVAAMTKLAGRVGLVGGGVATLLLAVAILSGEWLLTTVMGPGFGAAASTMNWQVAAAVIGVWALPLEPMLISLGQPGAVLRVRLIVAAAFLVALPPIVERYGMLGAGVALVGASTAIAIGLFLSLRQVMRSHPDEHESLASPVKSARKPDA